MTPHNSPSRASYGASFVGYSKKNYRDISTAHCIALKWLSGDLTDDKSILLQVIACTTRHKTSPKQMLMLLDLVSHFKWRYPVQNGDTKSLISRYNDGKIQNTVSISDKTSYRKISWSIDAAWFVFKIVRSLWKLTGTSATLLPTRLSNFTALR